MNASSTLALTVGMKYEINKRKDRGRLVILYETDMSTGVKTQVLQMHTSYFGEDCVALQKAVDILIVLSEEYIDGTSAKEELVEKRNEIYNQQQAKQASAAINEGESTSKGKGKCAKSKGKAKAKPRAKCKSEPAPEGEQDPGDGRSVKAKVKRCEKTERVKKEEAPSSSKRKSMKNEKSCKAKKIKIEAPPPSFMEQLEEKLDVSSDEEKED